MILTGAAHSVSIAASGTPRRISALISSGLICWTAARYSAKKRVLRNDYYVWLNAAPKIIPAGERVPSSADAASDGDISPLSQLATGSHRRGQDICPCFCPLPRLPVLPDFFEARQIDAGGRRERPGRG